MSEFLCIRQGEFIEAWYQLEDCEIGLAALSNHFTEHDSEFGI